MLVAPVKSFSSALSQCRRDSVTAIFYATFQSKEDLNIYLKFYFHIFLSLQSHGKNRLSRCHAVTRTTDFPAFNQPENFSRQFVEIHQSIQYICAANNRERAPQSFIEGS